MSPERRDPIGHTSLALTRRSAVTGAFATSAILVAARSTTAREATPAPGDVSYLFVQACESGSAAPTGDAGVYDLTLKHASGQTLFFADRPERVAGVVPTGAFLEEVASAGGDPPNAALALSPEGSSNDVAVAIVELTAPQYNLETGTITYQARSVGLEHQDGGTEDGESIVLVTELPMSFSRATLFIDSLVEPGQSYIIFDTEG